MNGSLVVAALLATLVSAFCGRASRKGEIRENREIAQGFANGFAVLAIGLMFAAALPATAADWMIGITSVAATLVTITTVIRQAIRRAAEPADPGESAPKAE